LELYRLSDDPGETVNLSTKFPERARQMRAALDQWRREVGARLPQPNPNYDPARATQLGGRDEESRKERKARKK
jgi:uncharacterized sulfatase